MADEENIEELRTRVRSLARETLRFRQLLEAAPDAIMEVDRNGNIVLLNKTTERLFGYERDELLGKPVEMLIPAEARGVHARHRGQFWSKPSTRHEAIFDRFYQIGQRQSGGLDGTGLGLAITRRLVEEHGGAIRLTSDVGVGSCFTFSIPVAGSASS